jgi:hypothetical protein
MAVEAAETGVLSSANAGALASAGSLAMTKGALASAETRLAASMLFVFVFLRGPLEISFSNTETT